MSFFEWIPSFETNLFIERPKAQLDRPSKTIAFWFLSKMEANGFVG